MFGRKSRSDDIKKEAPQPSTTDGRKEGRRKEARRWNADRMKENWRRRTMENWGDW